MLKTKGSETVCALTTPQGRSAIAIIRTSGPDSLRLLTELFGKYKQFSPRIMTRGTLKAGEISDDATAVYYKEPSSYTGEDAAEIFCHGSPIIANAVLRFLTDNGARIAERGEFTRRAFENGKLDLTAAEGVIDLIDSSSLSAARAAYNLAGGALKAKIEDLESQVAEVNAALNAVIDYPEEDLQEESAEESLTKIEAALRAAVALCDSYSSGRKIHDGVKVVICGRPNAGKSTLLNALVGYERAIVTDEAGTTRDTVEESYIYRGNLFKVTDTAGVRENAVSLAEQLGIERSVNALKEADVVIALDDEAKKIGCCAPVIKVSPKSDLNRETSKEKLALSAKTGEGIEELKQAVYDAAGLIETGEVLLTNLRQYQAVKECADCLKSAVQSLKENAGAELVAVDLFGALNALGSVTGAAASEKTVDAIFSRFCVGK